MHGSCFAKDSVITDAPSDAFECKSIGGAAGTLDAPFVTSPPKIDGDISDWVGCFVTLDSTNNPTRDLGETTFPSGRFSIEHDTDHIYVAIQVEAVLPLGDHAVPAIYDNDSVAFYIDGDGSYDAQAYGADAVQLVVDHANRQQAFRNPSTTMASGYTSAATTAGNMFTIELAVTPATFGLASFGTSIGFDIGIEAGDGTKQTSEVYWYQACTLPACGCSNGTTAAPYCDPREFGRANLTPP